LAVWHFLALFFEVGSTTQFCHQFGANWAATDDFVVGYVVENLAFFSIWYLFSAGKG